MANRVRADWVDFERHSEAIRILLTRRFQALTADPVHSILLLEDDEALAKEICLALAGDGHTVAHATDAGAFLKILGRGSSSMLIMDRMVGDADSIGLMERLRADGDRLPVLVISSLSTIDDRVRGLKAGGDDYLVKPFAIDELVARVNALLRRSAEDRRTALRAGPLVMDLIERTARRGSRPLDLLPREFGLLEYLMRHANLVVTRAMILEDVLKYNVATQTNVVDVHVGNLRRKVDAEGEARLISSVRGIGFKLDV